MEIMNIEELRRLLSTRAAATPEKIAAVDGQREISYGELNEMAHRVATQLDLCGVSFNDPLYLVLPDSIDFIISYFVSLELGAILVPHDEKISADQLFERIRELPPRCVITSRSDLVNDLSALDEPPLIISVGFTAQECLSFDDLITEEEPELHIAERPDIDDVFITAFTSGTTGAPKGVQLSYRNIITSAQAFGERLRCVSDDVFLVPVPLSHMFGLNVGLLLPILVGARLVLQRKFDPDAALEMIEKEKVSVLYGVPTMFIREIESQRKAPRDLSSLRTGLIGGASLTASLVFAIREDLRCNVMVAYASTEVLAISMTTFDDPPHLAARSVGRAFECVEVRVRDSKGVLLGRGIGEVVCRGATVMKGLLPGTGPAANLPTEDSWQPTGDIAHISDGGYLYVLGRRDDMIIRGGYNIFPSEIVSFYAQHPDVSDVCVVGLVDTEWGERIGAAFVLREGSTETTESLREYALGKLAKNRIPDRILIIPAIPKLSNGKTDTAEVRSLFLA
jgi:fatty-acyl-CoA synthase/long-chain acyl-CoA synthetase